MPEETSLEARLEERLDALVAALGLSARPEGPDDPRWLEVVTHLHDDRGMPIQARIQGFADALGDLIALLDEDPMGIELQQGLGDAIPGVQALLQAIAHLAQGAQMKPEVWDHLMKAAEHLGQLSPEDDGEDMDTLSARIRAELDALAADREAVSWDFQELIR